MPKTIKKSAKKTIAKKSTSRQGQKAAFVIVRSFDAGVFAGQLIAQNDKDRTVLLQNCIRLWYWDGAFTLSQLAMEGVTKPQNCKFSVPVGRQEIFNVIEILNTTPKAEKCIKDVESWRV